jgi:hypothetical protein
MNGVRGEIVPLCDARFAKADLLVLFQEHAMNFAEVAAAVLAKANRGLATRA